MYASGGDFFQQAIRNSAFNTASPARLAVSVRFALACRSCCVLVLSLPSRPLPGGPSGSSHKSFGTSARHNGRLCKIVRAVPALLFYIIAIMAAGQPPPRQQGAIRLLQPLASLRAVPLSRLSGRLPLWPRFGGCGCPKAARRVRTSPQGPRCVRPAASLAPGGRAGGLTGAAVPAARCFARLRTRVNVPSRCGRCPPKTPDFPGKSQFFRHSFFCPDFVPNFNSCEPGITPGRPRRDTFSRNFLHLYFAASLKPAAFYHGKSSFHGSSRGYAREAGRQRFFQKPWRCIRSHEGFSGQPAHSFAAIRAEQFRRRLVSMA